MAANISRFRGALVGAVVGDCLGAHFEGDMQVSMSSALRHFDAVKTSPRKKEGKFWGYRYTDDSAMTLAMANSLIRQPAAAADVYLFDAKDMANGFVDEFWREPNRGYGGNVISVFDALKRENCKNPYGPAERQFDGNGSYGNGGAMRISPAALFSIKRQPEEVDELISNITRITHTHRNGINGALLQCSAIQTALTDEKPSLQELDKWTNSFLDRLLQRMQKHEGQLDGSSLTEGSSATVPDKKDSSAASYCNKLEHIRTLLQEPEVDRSRICTELGNEVSALKSVPAAVYSFLRSMRPVSDIPDKFNEFQRTVIYAVSLGGDTDTIASMAGAIAGAWYGIDCIPAEWSDACEATNTAKQLADKLYEIVYAENHDGKL